MKKIVKASAIAGTAAVCASAAALAEFYRYLFYRTRSDRIEKLFDGQRHHSPDYDNWLQGQIAILNRHREEMLTMPSARGPMLRGFYYPAWSSHSKKIAFILHGYRSDHTKTAAMMADFYFQRGIDVFCCDHVASGDSEGSFIGYDYYEAQDCLAWIRILTAVYGTDIELILHGFSMGGATVMKMSDQCPPQVKFLVSDSGYTSAKDIFYHTLHLKPTSRAPYRVIDSMNQKLAHYSLADTDVRCNLQHTDKPILFVHGTKDQTVPYAMAQQLYDQCGSADKQLLSVEEAGHIESAYLAPQPYATHLDRLIQTYL